jgi:predicted AlkP superfamily phosphohydrolase/phosphomutase
MVNKPVIAIGLDAFDPHLMEKWMSQGYLPNLQQLAQQGTYGRLTNTVNYCGTPEELKSNDALWPTFITGCRTHKTGYWTADKYNPDTYEITCEITNSGFSYEEFLPFYALGDRYKVAVFDLPYGKIAKGVNGIQVLGWGGHYPYTASESQPAELFGEIVQKYGKNPILFEDGGNWWDKAYIQWVKDSLETSTAGRLAICQDLLRRDSWDLFLAIFNEPHTAGHDLYNRSQSDHPLYPYLTNNGTTPDPLLKSYQAIDRAIGEIFAAAPNDSYCLCFSPNGMGANFSELPCHVVLPELLYRFSFPGKVALSPSRMGATVPPTIAKPIRNSWAGEIWSKNYEANPLKRILKPWLPSQLLRSDCNGLASPYPLGERGTPFSWMPAMWYRPLWSQMKAFAIPGFTDGYIRINLQGREREGIVAPSEYDALCDKLIQLLSRLVDARTGEKVVKKVIRTRQIATDDDAKLPDADLVVVWEEQMTDTFDSPDLGRIGPLPYFRSGSHWARGFFLAKGSTIAPGSVLNEGETVDLAPTILALMGAEIPDYFEGQSLLNNHLSKLVS